MGFAGYESRGCTHECGAFEDIEIGLTLMSPVAAARHLKPWDLTVQCEMADQLVRFASSRRLHRSE